MHHGADAASLQRKVTVMQYEPKLSSVRKHQVPAWYHDAKFGIFIHWSLSCVPAFAPTRKGDIIEVLKNEGTRALFANQPYSEWYLNSIRIKGSPAYEYHAATYGEGYDYYNFADDFNKALDRWNPAQWCDLFKKAGARYVVPVTKHHDGFLLWPSEHPNPIRPDLHASRNVIGELTEAVKAGGMRIGFYYSSPYDWTFTSKPLTDFADSITLVPADKVYIDYVNAHWRELIDRYQPSLLWSDVGYPPGTNVNEIFAYFYNRNPEGVVDDRWSQFPKSLRWLIRTPIVRPLVNLIGRRMFIRGTTAAVSGHCDFVTPEYTSYSDIQEKKWECVRGMGKSFGYNREEKPEDFLTVPEAIRLLVDIVSKNGNLLLNVGPMPGGKIPDVQRGILEGMGEWLRTNGEAIYGTRPWVRAEGQASGGIPVRFTGKRDALFAILMGTPKHASFSIESLSARPGTRISLVAGNEEVMWHQVGGAIRLELKKALSDSPAHAIRITPSP